MLTARFSAPTGIPDDHELSWIFQYQPVHAGWISPLDQMAEDAYVAAGGVIPEASYPDDVAPVAEVPPVVVQAAGPMTSIAIPYASVADMRGARGFGDGLLPTATAPDPATFDVLVRLQKRQAFMQLVSTGAIVVIALTAIVTAAVRK